MANDLQLQSIRLEAVLKKQRLDQALNGKEFAVLAGISYSTARQWFRMPGFPVLRGVVFWGDFVEWRRSLNVADSGLAWANAASGGSRRVVGSGRMPFMMMQSDAVQQLSASQNR